MHNEEYTGYLNDFKLIKKSWGFEKIFINTFLYCVKELNIYEGCSTSKHYHKFKHETFYLVNGIANISIYDKKGKLLQTFTLNENESFCIEPNTPHSIENISFAKTLKILESSTQDKKEDNIRIDYV
jgi:mannose-6-phosphate isomerase-like protein (cupin superfamily)